MPILVKLIRRLQDYFAHRVQFSAVFMTLQVYDSFDNLELASYSVVDLLDDYRTSATDIAVVELFYFISGDIEEKLSKKSYDKVS